MNRYSLIRALCCLSIGAGFVSALVAGPRRVEAQAATGRPQERIDAIFQPVNRADSPGASVAVVQHGRLVFSKGYGAANLEDGAPITPQTVFHVASVSKEFTAMALVLLEQDGKLSLEDEVHKYLKELPDYGHPITIRNLLQHTSGIRDQWATLAIAGWRLDDVITQDQILGVLMRQKSLNFVPGTEHLYSNGGYTLAAEIVRRAGGKTLRAFCDERIFQPLGMTRTHFHDSLTMVVKNRAVSYNRSAVGFENAPLNYENVGATSLFATAEDLTRWLDNFRTLTVGGRAGVDRLQDQAVLTNGTKVPYALGLSVDTYRGLKRISHNGSDAGFRSAVAWFPDEKLGIAIVSNLGSFNPGQAASQVAEVFAEPRMTPKPAPPPVAPRPPVTRVPVDPKSLAQYAGVYQIAGLGTIEVVLQDDKLMAAPAGQTRLELVPVGLEKFFITQMSADVSFATTGSDMQIVIHTPGGEAKGPRTALPGAPARDLAEYAGVYWSDELETQYVAVVVDGKLRLRHIRHGEISLSPGSEDAFTNGTWFMPQVVFTRDAQGRVNGMRVGGDRVRGIQFTRR